MNNYTRRSDGIVDASDYVVWTLAMGTTFTTIVNPGDNPANSQVNEGFVTLPSLQQNTYLVKFRFEGLPSGESCDLATRVNNGLPNRLVVFWSSGAVRGTE